MEKMPCGLDDPRIRFEPDEEFEEEPLLTQMEERISWLCDEWATAHAINDAESWRDIRNMLYGASMALIGCIDRYDDRSAIFDLGKLAFEREVQCIAENRYEGAPE